MDNTIIRDILTYTVSLPWWAWALLCSGFTCLGYVAASLCAAARRGDDLEREYGPSLEEAEDLRRR